MLEFAQHMEPFLTDILVVGSGGAGLRAALAAKEYDPALKVTIITPGQVGADSLTGTACSDRMAFHVAFPHTPPGGDQAWKEHAKDIYVRGGCVSDPNLAVLLAYKAREAFDYLDKLGVPWVRTSDGKPEQFLTDGSAYPRACYTGPYTARDIHKALLAEVRRQGITILEGHRMRRLRMGKKEGEQSRLLAIDISSGESGTITASAFILATGGPGALFGSPLYPPGSDAIPFFMAMMNGARLVNLEFIQYGLASPETTLACSGSIPRALPKVVDKNGNEFLLDMKLPGGFESYLELLFMKGASWPVSAESSALPIDIEIGRERSFGSDVYFDFRDNPSGLNEKLYSGIVSRRWLGKELAYAATPIERLRQANPQVIEWFKERGVDLTESPIEVRHEAQHFQGGILINERAETGVPGLYACGECAGGQHGANRPGGNSLLDGQVMGAIAGKEAARFVSGMAGQPEPAADLPLSDFADLSNLCTPDGLHPDEIVEKLHNTLRERMGVFRTMDGLRQASGELDELLEQGVRSDGEDDRSAVNAILNIIIAQAFIEAASRRIESRGSHVFIKSTDNFTPYPADNINGRVWLGVWKNSSGKLEFGDIQIPKPKMIK